MKRIDTLHAEERRLIITQVVEREAGEFENPKKQAFVKITLMHRNRQMALGFKVDHDQMRAFLASLDPSFPLQKADKVFRSNRHG